MSEATQQQKKAIHFNRLKKRLERETGRAIADYNMIEEGDLVMVCLSGGKDSYTLLDVLTTLKSRAPINFRLLAMNLDQKQPDFPEEVLPHYLEQTGIPYRIVEEDTYSVVQEKIPAGKTTCSLCSRLRRGIIYRVADEVGATKIALGHHRDDIVETLFLNMFFGSKMKAMPPKLHTDDGRHIVIRPLAYCAEKDIEQYSETRQFPIIPCNLCGSQENLQRQRIKQMLQEWEQQYPGRTRNIFTALANVVPSHLADNSLYDFIGLTAQSEEEDTVFDPPEMPSEGLVVAEIDPST